MVDVVIVGAGVAGLSAARELTERGRSVRVLDKGRGVGGRMASRRGDDGARFDHGAQFFTVRSDEFRAVVEAAVADGSVAEWTRGFDDDPDGHPRYRGVGGMTGLAKWLARELDVRLGTTVVDLADHPADAHLLTAPLPQSLAVLSFSRRLPPPERHRSLAALGYHATVAVLLELDRSPSGFPDHGGVQLPAGHPDLNFVADNQRKGISDRPTVTAHLSHQRSLEAWSAGDDDVVERTVSSVAPWLGEAAVTAAQVQRWRYAGPVDVWPERCETWGSDPITALAGEIFGGPKVEGAFLSGLAAARAVDAALAA